jgi:GNAT superfamily N-acetyltransferase
VRGYLALADKTVTGYREPSARYREADSLERVGRACVLVVRVAPEGRRHGVARQLVSEAARHCGTTASDLAWAGPLTGNGYLLARSMAPNGMWIAGCS